MFGPRRVEPVGVMHHLQRIAYRPSARATWRRVSEFYVGYRVVLHPHRSGDGLAVRAEAAMTSLVMKVGVPLGAAIVGGLVGWAIPRTAVPPPGWLAAAVPA